MGGWGGWGVGEVGGVDGMRVMVELRKNVANLPLLYMKSVPSRQRMSPVKNVLNLVKKPTMTALTAVEQKKNVANALLMFFKTVWTDNSLKNSSKFSFVHSSSNNSFSVPPAGG